MIKASVMYPDKPDAWFDHIYYRNTHMPLVEARLGDACLFYTVDRGLAGVNPGDTPAFAAMCHIYCTSIESFRSGFDLHVAELMADISNFTNLTPVVVISEIMVGQS